MAHDDADDNFDGADDSSEGLAVSEVHKLARKRPAGAFPTDIAHELGRPVHDVRCELVAAVNAGWFTLKNDVYHLTPAGQVAIDAAAV